MSPRKGTIPSNANDTTPTSGFVSPPSSAHRSGAAYYEVNAAPNEAATNLVLEILMKEGTQIKLG